MYIKSFAKLSVKCVLTLSIVSCSPVKHLYKVAGKYENRSAQGMAVFKDMALLSNNTGICRVYDLRRDTVISAFHFGSAHKGNHSNCLDFGVEYPDDNKVFPALYISECSGKGRCFVESVGLNESKVIQTITFKERVTDWVVDSENKRLYAIAHLIRHSVRTDSVSIYCFALPSITVGDVDLSDKVEDVFHIHVPFVLQGATIHKNRLYMPVGIGNDKRKEGHQSRKLLVIDINKKQIVNQINLEELISNEPEDVGVYRGHLLLFCGQSGGIYPIKLKGM